MSFHHSPRIVTDGLMICVDAGNTKSHPGSGTAWYDLSGNNYDGTLYNGTDYSTDNHGVAVFNGLNSYATFSGGSSNDTHAWTPDGSIGLSTYSCEIWIKTGDTDGGCIMSKPWNGSGEYNMTIGVSGHNLRVGNQSASLAFASVATNTWKQLVIWVSATSMGYSINGNALSGSKDHGITNTIPQYTNLHLPFGVMTLYFYGEGWAGNTGHAILGNVACFKKYNRVLSEEEIFNNYNALKGRFGL